MYDRESKKRGKLKTYAFKKATTKNARTSDTVKAIFFLETVLITTAPFHTSSSLLSLCALSCIELMRLFLALVFRVLLVLSTESVEIVRIMVELVVFIFAAVRSLFPETVACHHTQVSLYVGM